MVWSYTLDTLRSVALDKNALKLEQFYTAIFSHNRGIKVEIEYFCD